MLETHAALGKAENKKEAEAALEQDKQDAIVMIEKLLTEGEERCIPEEERAAVFRSRCCLDDVKDLLQEEDLSAVCEHLQVLLDWGRGQLEKVSHQVFIFET